MDEVTFHIWHNGDTSVGVWGESASVTMHVDKNDKDMMAAVNEALSEAFTKIWDFKAFVMVDEPEINED